MLQTFDRHVYRILLGILLVTVAAGTVLFHLVEHFSWLDAYYFSIITLATVGYGDLTPHTALGKVLTTFYIFLGVGIFTTYISYNLHRRAHKFSQREHSKDDADKP
jgi:voltage-gated potassium channel Kch